MDAPRILTALRRRWYVFVVVLLAFVIGAAVWVFAQTPMYQSQAEVFVSSSRATASNADTAYQLSLLAQDRMATYAALAHSPQVLDPVRRQLNLDQSVAQLANVVSATNPPGTILLQITAMDSSPTVAADMANVAAKYLVQTIQSLEAPQPDSSAPLRATITTPATPSDTPSSPKVASTIVLAALVGALAGLAGAFLAERVDGGIRSEEDLIDVTGKVPLGVVAWDKTAPPVLTGDGAEAGARLEGYRNVRTNLRFASVDDPPRVIAAVSGSPDEGKTTLVATLGVVMAKSGLKVCLVDADLRASTLGDLLGIESRVGLTDVLSNSVSLDDAIQPWNRALLAVLARGPEAPNPAELLASAQFRTVLERLAKRYDTVLVDTSPLLPVADGNIVASATDGAVLMVRSGKTSRRDLIKAMQHAEQAGTTILGTVLTGVPPRRLGYGYGYGPGPKQDATSTSTA